jgi:DNA-binding CsgD family transcriptional regulator
VSMKLHPTYQTIQKIYDFCGQLRDQFNLTWFVYDLVFKNGAYAMITDTPEIFKPYYDQDLDPVCLDNHGRNLSNGWYSTKLIQSLASYDKPFEYFKQTFRSDMGLHYAKKGAVSDELFSFGFSCSSSEEFEFLMLNKQPCLMLFIQEFRATFLPEIADVSLPESRLRLSRGGIAEVRPALSKIYLGENQTIFNTKGQVVSFSPQQAKCLKNLIQGESIRSMSEKMGLSERTVENYFLSIREKLDCRSLRELVLKYQNQIELYF